MFNITIILIGILFYNSASSENFPSRIAQQKVDKTITSVFGVDNTIKKIDLNSSYYSIFNQDLLLAYFCIEEAPSKHDFFEFLVIYTPNLEIMKVQILVYRENYGYEIKNRRWLYQFTNRSIDSVQAISGATISVNSLKYLLERTNKKMKSLIN